MILPICTTLSSHISDPSWNLSPRKKTGVVHLPQSMYQTGAANRTSWGGESNILKVGTKWEPEFWSVALLLWSCENQPMDYLLLILLLKHKYS